MAATAIKMDRTFFIGIGIGLWFKIKRRVCGHIRIILILKESKGPSLGRFALRLTGNS
jgi:hypothetical protein